MKKLFFLSLCSILAFAVAIVATGEEQIAAPSLRDGDVWQFKVEDKAGSGMSVSTGIIPTGAYLIRFSDKRLRAFRLFGDQETSFEPPGMLFFLFGRNRASGAQSPQTPYMQDLQFPLFVGKKWQYTFDLNIPHGTKHRMVDIQVVGRESVQTSAGLFDAFRIEKTVYWPTANAKWGTVTNDLQAVYFYSPEAKCIVKYNSFGSDGAKREIELVKFGSTDQIQPP